MARYTPRGRRVACVPHALATILRIPTTQAERLVIETRLPGELRLSDGRVHGVSSDHYLRILAEMGVLRTHHWIEDRQRPTLAEWLLVNAPTCDRRLTLVRMQRRSFGHVAVVHRGRYIDAITRRWVPYGQVHDSRIIETRVDDWWTVDASAARRARLMVA
jgi:hypothetical protein